MTQRIMLNRQERNRQIHSLKIRLRQYWRYTLRIPQILLDKVGFIAEYEGRTKNKEIEQLIKRRIEEFEEIHGRIEIDGSGTGD